MLHPKNRVVRCFFYGAEPLLEYSIVEYITDEFASQLLAQQSVQLGRKV